MCRTGKPRRNMGRKIYSHFFSEKDWGRLPMISGEKEFAKIKCHLLVRKMKMIILSEISNKNCVKIIFLIFWDPNCWDPTSKCFLPPPKQCTEPLHREEGEIYQLWTLICGAREPAPNFYKFYEFCFYFFRRNSAQFAIFPSNVRELLWLPKRHCYPSAK